MGVNLPHMSVPFLPSNCVLLCDQLLMFCLIRSRWKHEGGSGWRETIHIIFDRPGARGPKHGHPGFRPESQRKEGDDAWVWVSRVCVIFSFTLMVFGAHWCGHHDGTWLPRRLLLNHMWLIHVSLIGNYIEFFIAYLPWIILFCEWTTVHSCVN